MTHKVLIFDTSGNLYNIQAKNESRLNMIYENSTPTKDELQAELERIKYQLKNTNFDNISSYAWLCRLYVNVYNDLLTLCKYE